MFVIAMLSLGLTGAESDNWAERVRGEEAIRSLIFSSQVNLCPVALALAPGAESRARVRRVISQYEDVEPPELGAVAMWDTEEWWDLYKRVTGVERGDVGWFWGVMPSPDDLLAMRTLWVKDRFREGWTREQVVEKVKGASRE